MDIKSARKVCDYLCSNFSSVDEVSFFGGEPFLCFDVIKYIVSALNDKIIVNSYEVTTNGTLLNEEIIDFLDQNRFKVIISLDGPKYIQEKLRVGCNYEKVISSIEQLKKKSIVDKLEINCTYTKVHKNNITPDSLKKYFDELKVKYTVSNVITEKEEFKIDEYKNINELKNEIDICYANLSKGCIVEKMNNYVASVIDSLVNKLYSECFCSELEYGMAFNTDGDIFPCEKLLNQCKYGDSVLEKINKKNCTPCKDCWARGMCRKCSADIYLKNEIISENDCVDKRCYEYALVRLVEYLEEDENVFQMIIDTFYAE